MKRIFEFDNEISWENFATEQIFDSLIHAIEKNGVAFLGLSGGKTPGKIYESLAMKLKEKLGKIKCFLIDERFVPYSDSNSNFKLISETFYADGRKIFLNNFFDFDTNLPLGQALKKYQEKLPENGFDVLILGAGEDGHFASVFPGFETVYENQYVAATQTDSFVIKQRLTVLPKLLKKSDKIFVLIKDKEHVLNEIRFGKKSVTEFPIKMFLDSAIFLVKTKKITL